MRPKNRGATIHDVAKLAGVGVGTASRALSGRGYVASETRGKIAEAVRVLDYRPSIVARALSQGQSDSLGVLIGTGGDSAWVPVLLTIEKAIRSAGKQTVVASSVDGEAGALGYLMERGCDGILLLGSNLPEPDLVMAAGRNVKLAIMDRHLHAMPEVCFSTDHRKNGRTVADYLLNQGLIGYSYFLGPADSVLAKELANGFSSRIACTGASIGSEAANDLNSGREVAIRLLKSGHPITAILCANDEIAVGARMAFNDSGTPVGIFGYGDSYPWNKFDVGINSVAIPKDSIALSACADLLNRCYGGDRPVQHHFEARLIIRVR